MTVRDNDDLEVPEEDEFADLGSSEDLSLDGLEDTPPSVDVDLNTCEVRNLLLSDILENSWNPNKMDDSSFNRLTEELRDVGCIDPIQVVPLEDGTYRILGGAHRFQAAKVLGWDSIPCVILSDVKWQDEDLQKLVTVRLNVLRGKIDPSRMVSLYDEMQAKYGEAALQGMLAYTDQDAWGKMLKSIGKGLAKSGLPKAIVDQFAESAKELKSVDDLSTILNSLFTQYGDTLQYNFMVFTFGGKEHIYITMTKPTKRAMDQVLKFCKTHRRDINEVFAELASAWAKKAEEEAERLGDPAVGPNPFGEKPSDPLDIEDASTIEEG